MEIFSPVAEPDPDDLLLHVEAVRHVLNLLAGRLRVLGERPFQRYPDCRLDGGSLLAPPPDGVVRVERVGVNVGVANGAGGVLGYNLGVRTTLNILEENSGVFLDNYLQPFREERFQLAHVLEGEVESFKSGNCCLREVVPVKFAHC